MTNFEKSKTFHMNYLFVRKIFTVILISLISFICFPKSIAAQNDPSRPLPQFLFPQFTKAIIKMKTGASYSALLNYNKVSEEFIFDQKGTYMALDKPEEIDTVFLQGTKFVYLNKCFAEITYKGKISLLYQHKSHYAPVPSTTAYGMTSQTAGPTKVMTIQGGNQTRTLDLPENVTVAPDDIYWVQKDGDMKKFTSERQFIKIFPEKGDKLKEFFKQNKIDLKATQDLIKLGNYCDTF